MKTRFALLLLSLTFAINGQRLDAMFSDGDNNGPPPTTVVYDFESTLADQAPRKKLHGTITFDVPHYVECGMFVTVVELKVKVGRGDDEEDVVTLVFETMVDKCVDTYICNSDYLSFDVTDGTGTAICPGVTATPHTPDNDGPDHEILKYFIQFKAMVKPDSD